MRYSIYYILILLFLSLQCNKESVSYNSDTNHFPGSYNHLGNPGISARDYLGSTTYKSLKIEIQYMPGFKPDSRAINIFTDLLSGRLNKPGGIIIEEKEIYPTVMEIFSYSDISNIESSNRTIFTKGDQMSAYILFTSGTYYNGNVIGLAYKNTSICFFGEPLKYFSGGPAEEDRIKIMALIITHEFGHLLGLVDMGTSMVVNHRDWENGSHCDNNKCLMHHTYEANTRNYGRILVENPSFDINCINDLKANGGK
jgi:predicted Zn-dependent protease